MLSKSMLLIPKLPLLKLVSISTDGAPAMVGSRNGFV